MSTIKNLIATNTTDVQIGISAENRQLIAENLGLLLADEHVLYIKLRNYHWNVTGMQFQPLHSLFEEQYDQLEDFIDDTAERIRSLGFFAPGSMADFTKRSRLVETDHVDGKAETMVKNLLRDHETLVQILRNDITTCEDKGDAGTADFLTAVMEEHEKMAWMLRAHLAHT